MRNFLVEFDRADIAGAGAQMDYVRALGMPWSTAVWSGGKSTHFVISLETPISEEVEYKAIARRVTAYLKSDTACVNPSRFTRLGGARRDNGNEQTILAIQGRVPNADFFTWLGKLPKQQAAVNYKTPVTGGKKRMPSLATRGFIEYGPLRGVARTVQLFAAAADLADCGYTLTEAAKMLSEQMQVIYKDGEYSADKALRTVEDGFRKAGVSTT
jgi:hypothetical protein